jgi:uridine kinase
MSPSGAFTSPDALQAVLARLTLRQSAALTLVGIDGLGAAGKSTLADALLMERPDATVVHGDDFYGPEERDWRSWTAHEGSERYFDHRRLESQLLRPLRAGRVASFQRYDWPSNSLDGWVQVNPAGLVIVEGVYLLRDRLRAYWDLTVFVDAPRELRQRRLHARGENDPGWIERWSAAEDYYERTARPADAADLVVQGG